jgi:WD40 repeat protein
MLRPPALFAAAVVLAIAPSSARGQETAAPPHFVLERTLTIPGGITHAAAFAPNGATLCTGGEVGDVILWDVKAATPCWRVRPGDHWIGEIAWPPAGDCIAVLGRELTVLDVRDGHELLRRVASGPRGLAFSPDGRRLAFQRSSGAVTVIALPGGEQVAAFEAVGYPINGLVFAADGNDLFAGDNAGRVFRLTRRDSAVEELYVHAEVQGGCACQAVGLCGGQLLTFGWSGDIRLGDRTLTLPGTLFVAAVAPGGEAFAAGGDRGQITVWTDRGGKQHSLDAGAQISALAFHPDGNTLAVATYDGALRLLRDGAAPRAFVGHAGRPPTVAWSPDGTVLAIGGERRTMILAHLGASTLEKGTAVCSGRAADEILTLEKGRITARNGLTTKPTAEWSCELAGTLLGPSPDGASLLVSDRAAGTAARFSLATGSSIAIDGWGTVLDAAWAPDGRLAIGRVSGNHGESGALELFDAAGKVVHQEKFDCGVHTVAFSPDASQLVYAIGGGSLYHNVPDALRVCSADGTQVRELAAAVRWFRFLDAHTAVAHDGAALSLWNLDRWQQVEAFPIGVVFGAVLAPDRSAVAVMTDADVRVVRIRSLRR